MTNMKLGRRQALALLASGAAALPAAAAWAQSSDSDRKEPFKIYQMTYRGETDVERGFRDYLNQRGIPVEIIHRNAERDPSRVQEFLKEIEEIQPDLVYTWGTPVTLATVGRYNEDAPYDVSDKIPVVFTIVAAPVASQVIPSFESSGRNLTGTFHVVPPDAQLRAVQSYRPIEALGVLHTSTEQNSVAIVDQLSTLAKEQGYPLIVRQFHLDADGQPTVEGYKELLLEIKQQGANWLIYPPDTFLGSQIDLIKAEAAALRLPTFGTTEQLVHRGDCLLGLICRYYSVGQLTAAKVEQILVEGRDPKTIPIETLKRFSLIVNMPVAKSLELYPPLAMLNYADVIGS
ncbi:MAG: ABC transporter substrate-binding protein [Pseudomonadota bacterium]